MNEVQKVKPSDSVAIKLYNLARTEGWVPNAGWWGWLPEEDRQIWRDRATKL